jgi:hypothetical protein
MKDIILQIGSELGIAALFIAAITFLAKLFFTKSAEAAVLKYGSELQEQLESHKSELELLKVKYQIQFSALNEKRGTFIAQLYSELYDLEQALQAFTSVFKGGDWTQFTDEDKSLLAKHKETKALFEKNRIYLENHVCEAIQQNFDSITQIIFEMTKAKRMGQSLNKPNQQAHFDEGSTPTDKWAEQDQKAREDIVTNRKMLAEQFRQLLGISPE